MKNLLTIAFFIALTNVVNAQQIQKLHFGENILTGTVVLQTLMHPLKETPIKNCLVFKLDKKVKFIAEPGRYFAESSHTLVLNVIGKKNIIDEETGDKIIVYYLNDGIYGSFGCIYFDHTEPLILPFNERNDKVHKSRLFGPTCDSIDLIANEIMLPELAIGEWVYVENFGAYTVASSSNFNGFKTNVFKYIFRS